MQYVKNIFFLVCCFLLGIAISKGIQQLRSHKDDTFPTPHIGIGNAPRMHGLSLPLRDSTAAYLATLPITQLHASAVAVSYPTSGNAARSLADTTQKAHQLGLDVVLVPPGFSDGNPYPLKLETVAQQAQDAKVDVLCLSWLNHDPDENAWAGQAASIRQIYKGKLILAATPEVLVKIESFDAYDFIGAIGPVPLARRLPSAPADVDLLSVRVFWSSPLGSLESRALKASRPLVLLNMAIPETITAKLSSPSNPPAAPTPNPALQELAYEALVVETKGRTFTEGLFLPWSAQGSSGDPLAIDRFPKLVARIGELWAPPADSVAPTEPFLPTPDSQPDQTPP